MVPNCAIHFHQDGFVTSRKRIMGRQSAGAGFLNGYFEHGSAGELHCVTTTEPQFRAFADLAQRARRKERRSIRVNWIRSDHVEQLQSVGCLYQPDCNIAQWGWLRQAIDPRAFSVCGVTHTICSAAVMDHVGALLTAPIYEWDAVVCTSETARTTIEGILENWTEQLHERIGARPRIRPLLPVIPLGVDCRAFQTSTQATHMQRQEFRQELGIGDGDVVFLYAGRLSFHAKAHPLPMYRALEIAAQRSGHRLHLICAGRCANQFIRDEFTTAARRHFPSVNTLFVDDSSAPEVWQRCWVVADVFTSLADNIQETFGLTPIEAMAAGLPLVVTDWNGYRNTVRHGVDGFRIPTCMPSSGFGEDLVRRYVTGVDTYDQYVGSVSQCTAVDTAKVAEAYWLLAESPDLRKKMGDAARRRAETNYDWRVVIHEYEELWQELRQRREFSESVDGHVPGRLHPLRDDPFAVFAKYSTIALRDEMAIAAADWAEMDTLIEFYARPFTNLARDTLGTLDEGKAILNQVQARTTTVAELLAQFPRDRQPAMTRTVVWLLKVGLIQVVSVGRNVETGGQEPAVTYSARKSNVK